MDDKWILRPPGSTKRTSDEVDHVAILGIVEVGKLADWVNRLFFTFPGSAEDQYIY
jgi:hypothetical protein